MSSENDNEMRRQLEEEFNNVPPEGKFWAIAYLVTTVVRRILLVAYIILFFPILVENFKWVMSIVLTCCFGVWPSVMMQLLKVEGLISNWDLTNLQYYVMLSTAVATFIVLFCKHAATCFFVLEPFEYFKNEIFRLLGVNVSDEDSDEDSDGEPSDDDDEDE